MNHPPAATPSPPWWHRHALLLAVASLGAVAWWCAPPPADDDTLLATRPGQAGATASPALRAAATPASAAAARTAAPAAATRDLAALLAEAQPLRAELPEGLALGLFGTAQTPEARVLPPAAAASATAPAAPPPAPAAAPEPPAPQALGVLRQADGRVQALLQLGDEVLVRRAGEAINAHWQLDAITPRHLALSRRDGSPQGLQLPVQPGDTP